LYTYSFHKVISGEKRYRAKKLADYIQRLEGVKTALDIGSMYGYLIEELKKKKIDCSGIEIDIEAVEYSRKRKLDVKKISLEEFLKQDGKKYDLIILSHVLEHLLEPRQKLLKLKKHLNVNGKILVMVPNYDSLTRKLFGSFWGYWDIPAHITHFNTSSLQYLVNLSGLKTKNSEIVGGSSLLFFSAITKKLSIKRTNSEISPLINEVIKFISAIVKYWYHIGNDEILLVAQVIPINEK
jgi:2-polyprenyl-3-methyl-5-hydroxy-6-metoxy-1,4-benzoquinol methylase